MMNGFLLAATCFHFSVRGKICPMLKSLGRLRFAASFSVSPLFSMMDALSYGAIFFSQSRMFSNRLLISRVLASADVASLRISACLRRWRSNSNKRAFSMAIAAWLANVCTMAACSSLKKLGVRLSRFSMPIILSFANNGIPIQPRM